MYLIYYVIFEFLYSPTTYEKNRSAQRQVRVVGLTCAVQMGVDGPMSGAWAGGAGVAVLGFGRAHTKAPYLAVRTVHHPHTPLKLGVSK